MAIPLKKFAALCEEVTLSRGNITSLSSPTVSLHEISRTWRELCNTTAHKDDNLSDWTQREVGAADMIIATLTYLQRIGCNDVEKLILDTLEQRRRKIL